MFEKQENKLFWPNTVFISLPVPDPRLRCVKELLYCEEVYSESLKCAFDLYAEPLRWEKLYLTPR